MRQIGIVSILLPGENPVQMAATIHKTGFDTVIVNYGTSAEGTRAHCRAMTDEGLSIDHIHAPFDAINTLWAPAGDEAAEAFLGRLLDCVDCCREFGVQKMVVHTSSGSPMPTPHATGLARFDRLMAHADACGVTVAYENQRFLPILQTFMERYPQAGFCWDVGHEACFTDGMEFMPLFGHRITCLHLHDNLGNYNQDSHLIPYDGELDMDRVARTLRQYGYAGPVMLESFRASDKPEQQERYGDLTAESYFCRAYEAAVRFRTELDT